MTSAAQQGLPGGWAWPDGSSDSSGGGLTFSPLTPQYENGEKLYPGASQVGGAKW